MEIIRFTKADRSSFPYWFAHWCAFNMTALNMGVWKWKYLFHDIEKPWLKLFWSYKRVQMYHNEHSNHHLIHWIISDYADWEAMIIDWECGRFTKQQCPRDAVNEFKRIFKQMYDYLYKGIPSDNKSINYIESHSFDKNYLKSKFEEAYIHLRYLFVYKYGIKDIPYTMETL